MIIMHCKILHAREEGGSKLFILFLLTALFYLNTVTANNRAAIAQFITKTWAQKKGVSIKMLMDYVFKVIAKYALLYDLFI